MISRGPHNKLLVHEEPNYNPTIQYKYDEPEILEEIRKYLEGTYSAHYVGVGNIQTMDNWKARGSAKTTCLDTASKYLDRFGKKNGENPQDIIKAIHYCIFILHLIKESNRNKLTSENQE